MKALLSTACALAMFAATAGAAQDANPVAAAAAALGADGLKSIRYSGFGSDYIFGQAYTGSAPWPRFSIPGMTVTIDFATGSWRDDRRRAQAENPPLGGGFQPLVGEQHQVWALSGGYAWDIVGDAVAPAAVERDMRSAVLGRSTQVWLTPQGFIKAAQAGPTSVRTETVAGARKTIMTVTTPLKVRLEGTLDERNLVERIETWLPNPLLGDIKLEATYSDYQDFGGLKFPRHIVQRLADYPVLDLTVTDVAPNVPAAMTVPAAIQQPAPAPAPLVAEKVSEGVWMVPGGVKSVVVEFQDHLVVIEAPETEARSLAVIDAIHKAIPNKPIRYVVNTHSHFDHAGGLRTYAAEGATILTPAANIPYYQQVFANPRTIAPDRLALSGRSASFEGIVASRSFRDATREMVIYPYTGNMHNAGMLMAFLPRERMLIEADSWTPPGGPNEAPGGVANLVQFLGVVDGLHLDVRQVLPIHGRITTLDDARAAAARFSQTQLFK